MKNKLFIFWIIPALLLAACMPTPVSQDVSLTRIADAAHGTMTAVAQGTPEGSAVTPAPSEAPAASATPLPIVVTQLVYVTATPAAPASSNQTGRLTMALGATDLAVDGNVKAGQTVRYTFSALKGQLVNLTLSTGSDAVLGVRNAAGTVLLDKSKAWTNFRVYLPAGGDWFIDVYGGKYDADFSLYMSIPARLSFAAGSSILSGKGTIGGGRSMQFILYARAGQTLTAKVDAAGAGLSIYAVEGTVLKSSMGEGASFEGKLPVTGDYIFNVYMPSDSPARNFSLNVEIK